MEIEWRKHCMYYCRRTKREREEEREQANYLRVLSHGDASGIQHPPHRILHGPSIKIPPFPAYNVKNSKLLLGPSISPPCPVSRLTLACAMHWTLWSTSANVGVPRRTALA